jgi:5'-deoxynucleotidase
MNHFFAYLFRMKHIRRWGLMRNAHDENLEEHSLEVALLAHALALIRRDVFGVPCDPERVAAAAMIHDASEILTGDLPTPVKYMTAELTGAYRDIERAAEDKLLTFIPPELSASYRELFESLRDPELHALVKAADRLAAHIKCVEELKTGNSEFRLAERQTMESLKAMDMPELDYFMERFLPSFGLALDEMT